MKKSTRYITITAILTALSTAIYFILPEIPIVPGIDYLKIDLSDMPAIAGAFVLGPVSGIIIELLKNLIHIARTTTFGIGEAVNFLIGGFLCIALPLIPKITDGYIKTSNKIIAYICYSILAVLGLIIWGLIVNMGAVYIYMKLVSFPLVYWQMVFGSIILNLVKATINIIVFLSLLHQLRVIKNKF